MRPAAVYIVAAAETSDGWPLVNADGAATSIAVHRTAPRVRTVGSRRSTGDSTPLDEAVRGASDASTCVVAAGSRRYQPGVLGRYRSGFCVGVTGLDVSAV